MAKLRALRRWTQDQINYGCIMLEGLFNTLGHDIIGATTIVPLFMAELGASMGLIGGMSTMRQIISAITPLLFGGVVAAARSKRNLSLIVNGIGRGVIMLIPLALLLGARGQAMTAIFFAIMAVSYLCQPITGISWNYLLGNCVLPDKRGKLLGTLFGISGVISFLSSTIVKAIRGSASLGVMDQYTAIFALGGTMMVLSVLCFIPLREKEVYVSERKERNARNARAYLANLVTCFRNRDYNWAIITNICSNIAHAVGTFFFIFAQGTLALSTGQVSNLLIIQTLGIMLGGFTTGRVSARFGLKRMLMMVEAGAMLVPALGLLAMNTDAAFWCAAGAVFVLGFTRSGMVGYQAYILEVVDPARSIYHIVAKSMALLPFSFVSVAIGAYLEAHSIAPVFVFQLVMSALAVLAATRLKLTVYKKKKEEAQGGQEDD